MEHEFLSAVFRAHVEILLKSTVSTGDHRWFLEGFTFYFQELTRRVLGFEAVEKRITCGLQP